MTAVNTSLPSTVNENPGGAAAGSGPAGFVPTHWSVVLAAKDRNSPQSQEALETLCRTYWYPLYVFARRQGHQPPDAQDLTQEFFVRLLQKDYLDAVERERGRFRTFLIMAFKRFLANEWDRNRAQKRGGGRTPLPLDPELIENRYQEEASVEMTADLAFDRHWAVTLLDQALARLRDEQCQQGKGAEFEILRRFLAVGKDPVGYGGVASQLGQSEAAVKMAVHRLRKRYRMVFREAIAQTVTTPADVEKEMRHLLEVLSR
jgi:RNA polymerase sigma factor (sigma-70 family)